jgi:hypothetical protein
MIVTASGRIRTARPPLLDAVTPRIDPLIAFAERARARAYLWSICEYELHEAVDPLQHDATRDGLTRRIGRDAVQKMIADAFAPYREAAS